MNEVFSTLYKRGVKGETRVWSMELDRDNARYRTISGIKDGNLTETGWTVCEPKNVGRSNETTAAGQAEAEVLAEYGKKLTRGYFEDEANIDEVPFTKPMLAQDYAKMSSKIRRIEDYYSNPKLDGIRCVARADGLWTRNGKPIHAVPHIMEELAQIFDELPDIQLDGELYNHDYRDNFNQLTSIIRKAKPSADELEEAKVIQYWVYDLPSEDATNAERAKMISVLCADMKYIKPVPYERIKDVEHLDRLYGGYLEDGYEGQMLRLGSAPYEFKRSNHLLKRKEFFTAEYKVLGVEEGLGNWSGAVKRFKFKTADGKPFSAGVRGTYESLAKLLTQAAPDWATVRFFTPTPDGIPRFPVVVDYGYGERED